MNTNPSNAFLSPSVGSSIFHARFQQHLNHLNDMAFNHTKFLKEMLEKPYDGSVTTSMENFNSHRKRPHWSSTDEKRPRKQLKPQHISYNEETPSNESETDEEKSIEHLRDGTTLNRSLMTYLHDLVRINPIETSLMLNKFNENQPSSMHPTYFSPSFYHSCSPMHYNHSYPFHLVTPKKRRTKVTDTRLSPRLPTKISQQLLVSSPCDEFSDDEQNSSNHSSEMNHLQDHQNKSDVGNTFQIILTSVHLRKAKLMFFYTRYPSSSMLKAFFPDVRFNKIITAQLVKWFSNFREFFYSQIEKFARQYVNEGVRHIDELNITINSDLYRILNLHYNRSNQIEIPKTFRDVVEATLREFYRAIQQQKDQEPSWKKNIYKIIQRLDEPIPECFKQERWMHSI